MQQPAPKIDNPLTKEGPNQEDVGLNKERALASLVWAEAETNLTNQPHRELPREF